MGYLLIDNRANHGGVLEQDTLQCPHCGSHFVHEPQIRGAFCMKCGAPVCERPACVTECRPFWQRVSEGFKQIGRAHV